MMRSLALILVILAGGIGGGIGGARAFDPFGRAGIDQKPGASIPMDLPFRDQTGATVTLGQIGNGQPLLLAPVLHDCPNICGVTLSGLMRAIAAQDYRPGQDFQIVAFGIDPREGPDAARASLDALRRSFPDLPPASLHGLTGTADMIAAITDALGYRYAWDDEIGQYAHVAAVAVLDGGGRLDRWLYGVTPEPTDLRLALTEAGDGRLGDWGDQILLLCYHYDPETGQYGSIIWALLRIAGGAVAAGGAGWIGLALLRERLRAHKAPGAGQDGA
ncbi:SCO family protein (plasmid) [Tistrella bauzanensis]|uniref:SCO family protein n=1 Tax=Tistrella arctica TaxID=3133430 RepID=A0ABU9YNS8_9PROT